MVNIDVQKRVKSRSLKVIGPLFSLFLIISMVIGIGTSKISLKDYMAIITAVFGATALVSFYYGFLLRTQELEKRERLTLNEYLFSGFMSVVFAGAYVMLLVVFSYLVVHAYQGAIVLKIVGIFGIAATASFAAYLGMNKAGESSTLNLAGNLATFMFGGLLLSALSETDPHWYFISFSYLGMTPSIASQIFNFTMVFSGFGAIVVTHFLYREFQETTKRNDLDPSAKRLRWLLLMIGVGISFVGLIPYKEGIQGTIHTLMAYVSGFAFGLVTIFSRKLIPGLPKVMYQISYFFAASCALSTGAFVLGYVTLASIELIIFISVFIWVYLMAEAIGIIGLD